MLLCSFGVKSLTDVSTWSGVPLTRVNAVHAFLSTIRGRHSMNPRRSNQRRAPQLRRLRSIREAWPPMNFAMSCHG